MWGNLSENRLRFEINASLSAFSIMSTQFQKPASVAFANAKLKQTNLFMTLILEIEKLCNNVHICTILFSSLRHFCS